ncbi:MAG: HpcH/HpaI aldolase/citrate lyase family protein [Calditrichaeota bacterium]|jgi:citrate lyase subunit beta / citryl-CoA lyase|nr:HpcH/HpaI aldolase/citrate lyase family protein [Calditrichota bacterium]MBT7617229.1 HpcH/HpaI aldolase/citrate lyase family protein [Calditrichota bacterium]MBT7789318.1 HpcH/HpaI aldolase/citrate lyase family protein [Calditrichota bacterium]
MPTAFTAGRLGDKIRSDCWVELILKQSGGILIELESKVESMYGDSTRELCKEVLSSLKIENASINVIDYGALPFTIAARIETAARRAGLTGYSYLPELKPFSHYTTKKDRFRRSRLYIPGNDPKYMINAGLHKPDAIILDLEDSVAPPEKDAACALVRNALRHVNFYGSERMVRINQGELGLKDLEWIIPHNVHVVLIPKVEDPSQVTAVDERIAEIKSREKIEAKTFLMPIIESALGGIKAYEIASASPNISALALGLEDYTADIGVQRTLEGRESFWLRSVIVNAARAARVQPIDTVFTDVADMVGLRESVIEAKSLGFDGKGCIHPRQIPVVHEAFAPTALEISKAKKIVIAFENAERKGLGVVSLGSKMIDPPVVKRALNTINMAESLGILTQNWRGESR